MPPSFFFFLPHCQFYFFLGWHCIHYTNPPHKSTPTQTPKAHLKSPQPNEPGHGCAASFVPSRLSRDRCRPPHSRHLCTVSYRNVTPYLRHSGPFDEISRSCLWQISGSLRPSHEDLQLLYLSPLKLTRPYSIVSPGPGPKLLTVAKVGPAVVKCHPQRLVLRALRISAGSQPVALPKPRPRTCERAPSEVANSSPRLTMD